MNFKKMITLIEMLALTGVMSVGFSTWVIVETSFPEMQVKVETENVFNTNDYLKIKNFSFSDYSDKGFYLDFIYTETPSTTQAQIFLDIEINLVEWRKLIDDSSFTKLNFDFTLIPGSILMTWFDITCKGTYIYNNDILANTTLFYDSTNKCWDDSLTFNEYSSLSSVSTFTISAVFLLSINDFSKLYSNYISSTSFNGFKFTFRASMGGE